MVRLIEFARNASDIKRTLIDRTPKIVEHFLKLIVDPKNPARNHWIQEIYSFIKEIDITKATKRFPKASFIYDNSYGAVADRVNTDRYIQARLSDIEDIEHINTDMTTEEVKCILNNVCTQYFQWLSVELSNSGVVMHSEVRSKVDELLEKYSLKDFGD